MQPYFSICFYSLNFLPATGQETSSVTKRVRTSPTFSRAIYRKSEQVKVSYIFNNLIGTVNHDLDRDYKVASYIV